MKLRAALESGGMDDYFADGCNHCGVNCKKVGLETMMRLVSHRLAAWCMCACLRCLDVILTCAFCPAPTVET